MTGTAVSSVNSKLRNDKPVLYNYWNKTLMARTLQRQDKDQELDRQGQDQRLQICP